MFCCLKLSRVISAVVFCQLSLLLLSLPPSGLADTFGSGEHTFEIEFVTIGEPGNPADTTGNPNPAGSVPYLYRIGKYEVSEAMVDAVNALTEGDAEPIERAISRGPNKPATGVMWWSWARFANWLNTSTGNHPAYKFDDSGNFQLWEPGDAGYNPNNLFRNRLAKYVIPSADEWYKAAFYDPDSDVYWDFPNGRDAPPMPVVSGTDENTAVYNADIPADITLAGGPSPFGTVAQAGNVLEWEETAFDLLNDTVDELRGLRGFHWSSTSGDNSPMSSSIRNRSFVTTELLDTGIRIASVPEPTTNILLLLSLCCVTRKGVLRCLGSLRIADGVALEQ